MIKIEIARLFRFNGTGSVKALADVTIADSIVITGFRVIDGKDGLFVSMPAEARKDGKWFSTIIPLTREIKDEFERVILTEYNS